MEAVLPLSGHTHKTHILWRNIAIGFVVIIALALVGGRIYLPVWLTDYVNRQINGLEGYDGGVSDIDVALWRGAYQIHDLRLNKVRGGIKEPFVSIGTTDLSIEWKALLHGSVVAEIELKNANLNFAKSQTGAGTDWEGFIDSLIPFDINRLDINGGKVAYIDHSASPDVNLYINNITAHVTNLQNVTEQQKLLPSDLVVSGNSIGNGKLNITGQINILKNTPDFDLDAKLENAQLPAFNNYANEIAAIDFSKGRIGVYSELASAKDRVTGYVKIVANDIELDYLAAPNPINALWEALVAAFMEIFKNQPRDQFALTIPIEGSLENPDQDSWAAFFSIFENAFGRAFSRNTEGRVNIKDILNKPKGEVSTPSTPQPPAPAHKIIDRQ